MTGYHHSHTVDNGDTTVTVHIVSPRGRPGQITVPRNVVGTAAFDRIAELHAATVDNTAHILGVAADNDAKG